MGRRLDLHHTLRDLYEKTTGKYSEDKVYYQPPSNLRLSFPCIIYKLTEMPPHHADNRLYRIEHMYELTVIDSEPNSLLREEIANLQNCRFVRSFESDNLHHYVFHIYD